MFDASGVLEKLCGLLKELNMDVPESYKPDLEGIRGLISCIERNYHNNVDSIAAYTDNEKIAYFKFIGLVESYLKKWSSEERLEVLGDTGFKKIEVKEVKEVIEDESLGPLDKIKQIMEPITKNVVARDLRLSELMDKKYEGSLINRTTRDYVLNNYFSKIFTGKYNLTDLIDSNYDDIKQKLIKEGVISSEDNRTYVISGDERVEKVTSAVKSCFSFKKRQAISEFDSDEVNLDDLLVIKEGTGLDKVAGLEEAKKLIESEIVYPVKYPQLVKGKKFSGFILYGPPGCGKTLLASTIPAEIGKKLISVSAAEILSKWVGDSEKYVKSLFKKAREENAAVFVDEIEALVPRDADRTHQVRLISQFLHEMDGINKSEEKVIVIGATNKPWDIYDAFLRPERFGKQVYVGLPDDEAKIFILKSNLKETGLSFKKIDFDEVINQTEGFSGADIASIATEVVSLYNQKRIEQIKKIEQSDLPDEDKKAAINDELNKQESISQDNLLSALAMVKPSVKPETVEAYKKWGADPKGKDYNKPNGSLYS